MKGIIKKKKVVQNERQVVSCYPPVNHSSCRGVIRTLLNIYDGAFRENSWQLKVFDCFLKKLHDRYLTGPKYTSELLR